MFCPSPRVPFAAGRTGETGALIGPAWWLPSSSWLRTLEAFHYFMESVASPTSPYPSISIPRHSYMLNDVLIICHFRLSALESSVYTETYASTLLFLGTPSIYSAELPTIPCYGLYVPCFHNSQVSFPVLPVSSCCHMPGGLFLLLSVMKMLPGPYQKSIPCLALSSGFLSHP